MKEKKILPLTLSPQGGEQEEAAFCSLRPLREGGWVGFFQGTTFIIFTAKPAVRARTAG